MDPSLGLLAASGLANFLLKTTAEWLVCLLLVRVAGSARSRFNVWLTMLLGFAAQWVWMWVGIVRAAFPATAALGADVHAGGVGAAGARIAVAARTAGTVAQAMVVLLACYVAVVAWRMTGTLVARVRLARAMRHKSAPVGSLATSFREALEQTAEHVSGLGECELWVLPGLASPATLGWRRPRVIVPPVCQTQDAAELKVVFWHELKHVERRDALWNAVVRACRNVLWFHPCVHHATAALNAERELACDAAVVREHPQSRDVYASCLVRFARQRELAPERAAVVGIEMASGAALLTTRVRSILDEAQSASRASRAGRAAVSVMLVGAMAATMPTLNVLFAAEATGPALQVPMALDAPIATKRHNARRAGAGIQETETSASVAASLERSEWNLVALPHDEGLAAEHRAAMGILTESTGMDAPGAGGDGRVSASPGGAATGRGSGGLATPSWTSVAVDAAERMGPLMANDHDADDRH